MSVQNSRIAQGLTTAGQRFRAALDAATTTRQVRTTVDRLRAVAASSRLAAGVAWSARAVRASWLYNWFTAKPDPDVVVIDLRETHVVGPVIRILDSTFDGLSHGWARARSGQLLEGLHQVLLDRPIQIVSGAALAAVVASLTVVVAIGSTTEQTVGFILLAAAAALAGTRVRVSWDEVTDSRTYELLVALFEPPEPPEPPQDR
ncbi:hypothetical protein [Halosimplex amylolyticum]|uniref:hypothetical protein n=1 Tax=Halosimplex amylolyticum TaxID=3396616 RepID=UPI003F577BD2